METSYWCVLVAGFLPYLSVAFAKSRMPLRANAAPREFLAHEEGWRKRAAWAERNAFEAFPLFATAVLVAKTRGAEESSIAAWALAFIGFRLAYLACYLLDWSTARSLTWTGGVVACVALFFV